MTFKELLCLEQHQLHALIRELEPKNHYKLKGKTYTIFIPKHYEIFPLFTFPLFTCHMDTVSKVMPYPEEIIESDGVLSLSSSSKAACLGGDDRCGVWIALQLLPVLHDAAFGFFEDEETGCVGSFEFTASGVPELDSIQAVIGLDRRTAKGEPEIASYDMDNEELLEMLPPYKLKYGTFSDNLVIAESLGIATYNIGVGYDHEHTKKEVVYLETMKNVMEELKNFYLPKNVFYDADPPDFSFPKSTNCGYSTVCCELCGEHRKLYEYQMMYVCDNCIDSFAEVN